MQSERECCLDEIVDRCSNLSAYSSVHTTHERTPLSFGSGRWAIHHRRPDGLRDRRRSGLRIGAGAPVRTAHDRRVPAGNYPEAVVLSGGHGCTGRPARAGRGAHRGALRSHGHAGLASACPACRRSDGRRAEPSRAAPSTRRRRSKATRRSGYARGRRIRDLAVSSGPKAVTSATRLTRPARSRAELQGG